MNRKRVDTNPVRRLAAFQRRLRPIPAAFDVLSNAPILQKHELNHSRYQTKVYGAKWNQEIENNHRQTWIEDGRTSEGALERIRRHSCPLSQFTPVEMRK